MKKMEKIIHTLTWWASCIGQVALFGAMAIVVANILLRLVWRPIPGTVELTEIFGAILLAMGISYCALQDGHISVNFVVEKLSAKKRALINGFTSFVSFILLSALAVRIIIYATSLMTRGATTSHLGIPTFWVAFLVSFGFVMLAMVLLLDLIKKITIIAGKESENN